MRQNGALSPYDYNAQIEDLRSQYDLMASAFSQQAFDSAARQAEARLDTLVDRQITTGENVSLVRATRELLDRGF